MIEPPSIRAFIRAFGAHWFEYMSGGPSVPLMIASLFIEPRSLAIATGILGIFCGVLAAYLVWQDERRRAVAFDEILNRQLELRFEPHAPWFLSLDDTLLYQTSDGREVRGRSIWALVEVHNPRPSTTAHGCRPYVKNVQFRPSEGSPFERTSFGSSQALRWSKISLNEAFNPRSIGHSERCFVDVLSTDHLHPYVALKWKEEWVEHAGLFKRIGDYRITVGVSSDDAGEAEFQLLTTWNGKWDEVVVRVDEGK